MRAQFEYMLCRIVLWMMRCRVDLIASYFECCVRTLTTWMECRGVCMLAAHCIYRLHIRSPVFHLVNMTLVHCHYGLCGMETARMAILCLMKILHVIQKRLPSPG